MTSSFLSRSRAAVVRSTARALSTSLLFAVGVPIAACDAPRAPVTGPRTSTSGVVTPRSDARVTLGWNALARTLVERNAPNQQYALRAFAYLAVAQSEAAVRAQALRPARSEPLARLAISEASAIVLRAAYPADAALIADELAATVARERAEVEPGPSIAAAVIDPPGEGMNGAGAVEAALHEGQVAGELALARMSGDGFDATWTGTVPVGPGYWYSALTPPRPPLLPLLGKARTFYMTSGDQFRPGPPPALGSAEFRTAVAEVRHFSDTRTREQQRIAEKWAMATGSLVAGYWNDVTAHLVADEGMNEREAAHAFALVTTAAWDANVACHDAKYTYWMIRPSEADAGITTAIGLPNHPSYPSNHSCLSGTAAIVLGALFPAQRETLWASALEASESRVYAGLHYRFDLEAGLGIAKSVAGLALAKDRAAGGRF